MPDCKDRWVVSFDYMRRGAKVSAVDVRLECRLMEYYQMQAIGTKRNRCIDEKDCLRRPVSAVKTHVLVRKTAVCR